MKRINQDHLTHEEWLESRRHGIGGSDAGAIMGFNKYKSPFTLYLEKIGCYKNDLDSEAAYFGNVLEDVVRKEFEKRTGKVVTVTKDLFIHDDYNFMQANIDGWIEEENAILECKTASEFLKDEWTGDEVPASYLCQVHHYMAVTGAERAYIAVLVGGNKFVWKIVEKNLEFEQILIKAEKEFWESHVLEGIPPEIDGYDSTSMVISELYPEDNGNEIMLGETEEVLIEALELFKRDIKDLEQQKKKYENILKERLKKTKKGHTQKHTVIYSSYETKRIDSKRLRKEHPDLFDEYSNVSVVRKMTIQKMEE